MRILSPACYAKCILFIIRRKKCIQNKSKKKITKDNGIHELNSLEASIFSTTYLDMFSSFNVIRRQKYSLFGEHIIVCC